MNVYSAGTNLWHTPVVDDYELDPRQNMSVSTVSTQKWTRSTKHGH